MSREPRLAQPFVTAIRLARDRIENPEAFPFTLPCVRNLDRLELDPKMTFLVGENGVGKSTLIEAIAVALRFNPEGGSRNFNFSTRASHSNLHEYLVVERTPRRMADGFFFRAESFFNVATELERVGVVRSYGGRSLHEQSHGEAFLSLLEHRFNGGGVFVLDEPEAALSPSRQLTVLRMFHDLLEEASQFIIATHSPILLSYPGACIYHVSQEGIERVAYEDTEHFQVSRDFLAAPERMLRILLSDEDD